MMVKIAEFGKAYSSQDSGHLSTKKGAEIIAIFTSCTLPLLSGNQPPSLFTINFHVIEMEHLN